MTDNLTRRDTKLRDAAGLIRALVDLLGQREPPANVAAAAHQETIMDSASRFLESLEETSG